MKLRIEHFVIIGLFAYVLFLNMCSTPKVITEKVVERYSDTTIVHDTVEKTIVEDHYHLKPVNVHDTLILTMAEILKLDTFDFPVNDSLLTAKIQVLSEKYPVVNFSYELKHHETTKTITIKDSTVVERLKNEFFIGAIIGGSQSSFMFAPKVDFKMKNGFMITGGYDVMNKQILIGTSKKIAF